VLYRLELAFTKADALKKLMFLAWLDEYLIGISLDGLVI
jgi:hypothetical protein